MRFPSRRILSIALALAAPMPGASAAVRSGSPAGSASAPATAPARAEQFQIPVGDAVLDIDEPQIDDKMGGAFVLGLRSGSNNCYVEALSAQPGQQGEIAFVVKPPAGEGKFLVTLTAKGRLETGLVECVRQVFGMFYHYDDKTPFDSIPGTLTFTPRTVAAPPLPTEAEMRAALETEYAASKVVRVSNVVLKAESLDSGSSNEVFKRYAYAIDLVFVTDGYESACYHYELYKVFTAGPYRTPYAGHSCESKPHKAGDHTVDTARLTYSLKLWPEIAAEWELHGGGITGTVPTVGHP